MSFILEGSNAAGVKPLVFPVTVEAKYVRCGPSAAIEKLVANSFVQANNRQITDKRRELFISFSTGMSEIGIVKIALFTVYAALPMGSLQVASTIGHDGEAKDIDVQDIFSSIAEPAGWNDILDQAWRNAVLEACSPVALMECVLLLEYYINKSWLGFPNVRLLNALPNPHFSIRCCTVSSVALRVFCLDKCVLYEKVFVPPREHKPRVLPSRNSQKKFSDYDNEDDDDVPEESEAAGEEVPGRRGQRQAAIMAAKRLKRQRQSADSMCLDGNDEAPPSTRKRRGRGRAKHTDNSSEEEDEEDYDTNEDEVDEEEDEAYRVEEKALRQSSRRQKSRLTYNEDVEEDDDEKDSSPYLSPLLPPLPSTRTKGNASSDGILLDVVFPTRVFNIYFFDTEIEKEEEKLSNLSATAIDGDANGEVLRRLDTKIRCFSILRELKRDAMTEIFWTPVDTKIVRDYRFGIFFPYFFLWLFICFFFLSQAHRQGANGFGYNFCWRPDRCLWW